MYNVHSLAHDVTFVKANTNIIMSEMNSMTMETKRWCLLITKISMNLFLKVEEVDITRTDKRPF